jgi:hypothetical protein
MMTLNMGRGDRLPPASLPSLKLKVKAAASFAGVRR